MYSYADSSYIVTEIYGNGEMEGPFSECSSIIPSGTHGSGCRSGILLTFDEFGESVIGAVDEDGRLTGDNIVQQRDSSDNLHSGSL